MKLQSMRKVTSYAMMVIAFAALQLSGELSPVVSALFLLAVPISWFWESPRINHARWTTFWTGLTLSVFVFTVADIFLLGEFFLVSALNFVIFMATAKLFQRAENKDYPQLMALSLLLLGGASALNEDLSFGLLFAAYVIVSTLALVVQHLVVEVWDHDRPRMSSATMERAVFWTTLLLAGAVFMGSVVFFFAFPRVGFGFFLQQSRDGVETSGFSEDVSLGSHGTIRTDSTVVMRAIFPQEPVRPIAEIHWRGLSLNHFDGRSWSDRDEEPVPVSRFDDGRGYGVMAGRSSRTWEEITRGTERVEINLEPMETGILFGTGRIQALELPNALTELPDYYFERAFEADRTGEVQFVSEGGMGIRYVAHSSLPHIHPPGVVRASWPLDAPDLGSLLHRLHSEALERQGQPVPDDLYDRPIDASIIEAAQQSLERYDLPNSYIDGAELYLQLPDGYITDRIRGVTAPIRADHPQAYEFTSALEEYLRTSYAYTTNLPEPSAPDSNLVEDFLFEWQRGHCEYFATVMVVLLRSEGIPARIVNGYLGGDFNSVGGYVAVRQAHAHSWVEVYFPNYGWLEFDPTPGGAAPPPEQRFRWLNEFIDSLRLKWFRWVVEYDLEKQASTLRDTFERISDDESSAEDATAGILAALRSVIIHLLRNLRGISLLVILHMLAAFVLRYRARNRVPWGRGDHTIGAVWIGLGLAVAFFAWEPAPHVAGVCLALVPSVAGLWVARQLRLGLFGSDDDERERSRGSDVISRWYSTILRDAEFLGENLPLGVTPSRLVTELDLEDDDLRSELAAFVSMYRTHRFGGRPIDETELEAWRPRYKALRKRLRRHLRDRAKKESSLG